jgi:chitinase
LRKIERKKVISMFVATALWAGCSGQNGAEAPMAGGAGGGGSAGSATDSGTGSGGTDSRRPDGSTGIPPGTWINLYYPGWTEGTLPISDIDLTAVTQVMHFALVPTVNEGGAQVTLDDALNGVGAASAKALVDAVHAAGKKVLITVGGSARGSRDFAAGIADPAFVPLIVSTAVARGYDGIDIDVEARTVTAAAFQDFSRQLRQEVDRAAPQLVLTTAALGASAATFGPVADVYDEINIMTYDLVYGVTVSWHDSPISGGVGQFYSVDRATREFEAAGVPRAKLGFGLKFSGFTFAGTSDPMKAFTGRPTSVPYSTVMSQYYTPDVYRWDDANKAAYLSIASPAPLFVTYEDEQSISAKLDFLRAGGYGGIILWDASGGLIPTSPAGQRLPLMGALRRAALGAP